MLTLPNLLRPGRYAATASLLFWTIGFTLYRVHAAETSALPEWKAMDYGPYLSASLEVAKGNIANKGLAIRLDPGEGGAAKGNDFFLFETDTLRAATAWSGSDFIDWKNIAFDGSHEVHASILGEKLFSNPDAPGWADPEGEFKDKRLQGRDGLRYGPLPRSWGHWRGLYLHGNRVILSYAIGNADVLESPGLEGPAPNQAVTRTFHIGPHSTTLVLQVKTLSNESERPASGPPSDVGLVGAPGDCRWSRSNGNLRLSILPNAQPVRFKLVYVRSGTDGATQAKFSPAPEDLLALLHGGPRRWTQSTVTRVEPSFDLRQPYVLESISLPLNNPYHSWMRLGGFDFFKDGKRAAVCTWQGDVWLVDGLGGNFGTFNWTRIASGMFQPLGLRIVDERIYVTCRDQITRLHDLNGDGEIDFYENFNNDAQVTEHFHEFAMDLQTDANGDFYYAKGGRHAKDALVPQHGTLLSVSKDGSRSTIVASGFRAPNGVCVNPDGTFIVSDQEGHWTPENRINWVKPGGFYGYMMGYQEGRQENDFEPPIVWVHKSLDRSPAEQLWVTSEKWGLPANSLIALSYGTGKIFSILYEKLDGVAQGAIFALPIPAAPTGIMRGRFHPGDGQLYTAGLFGWAGDKTRPGGFYRVHYTGKPLHVPTGLRAVRQGILLEFNTALNPDSAADGENFAVSRWTYRRTANYGSDDYRLSQPGQKGRDSVEIKSIALAPDRKSLLLMIPDLQPCMQMELKYDIRAADGTRMTHLIENTIHRVGGDCPFPLNNR